MCYCYHSVHDRYLSYRLFEISFKIEIQSTSQIIYQYLCIQLIVTIIYFDTEFINAFDTEFINTFDTDFIHAFDTEFIDTTI